MTPYIYSLSSQENGEMFFTESVPIILNEQLLNGARPIVASCPSGHFLIQAIKGEGFSCQHHTILLNRDDSFRITSQLPVLSLNFCLQNSFFLFAGDEGQQLTFHEGQNNVSFMPRLDLTAKFQKDRIYTFLTVFYSPEYFLKLSQSYPDLKSFVQKMTDGKEALLHSSNQITSNEMKQILCRFLNEEYKDEETNLCIKKGRMMELLAKAVESNLQPDGYTPIRLTRLDAEKIYDARNWLTQQFNRPVTLFELSRRVGLNVHKLSNGFFQITGNSVFHYQRSVRMRKAIELLDDTDRSLFDVGTEIGYTDGKTFSKEFKKYTGITPIEYRRNTKLNIKGPVN